MKNLSKVIDPQLDPPLEYMRMALRIMDNNGEGMTRAACYLQAAINAKLLEIEPNSIDGLVRP